MRDTRFIANMAEGSGPAGAGFSLSPVKVKKTIDFLSSLSEPGPSGLSTSGDDDDDHRSKRGRIRARAVMPLVPLPFLELLMWLIRHLMLLKERS